MTPLEIVLFVLLLATLVAVFALLRERYRLSGERDVARARLEATMADEQRLKESFESLAGKALATSSSQFLALAEQKLAAKETSALSEMDKRKKTFEELVGPIADALKKTDAKLGELEKERGQAYAGLLSQVRTMSETNAKVREEANKLVQALSKPVVRGRYGEVQLQRVAELAGMRAYCDFGTQESMRDQEGRLLRPDMVVRLPNERVIAVDAKTNIEFYLAALQAGTPEEAEAALVRFATHVADQAVSLSKKGYWKEFTDSPEFVVMFVPGDQFVDAALERRPDLIDVAAQHNVVLASPSTLIGLLRAVHVGWREKKLSDSARELFTLGRELHERVAVALDHADRVGDGLKKAVESYNRFVASVDTRLIPSLRKIEEHGVKSASDVVELTPVEGSVRRSGALPAPAEPAAEAPIAEA